MYEAESEPYNTYHLHPANAGITDLSCNRSNSSLLYCKTSHQGVHRLLGQVEKPSPIDGRDIDGVGDDSTRVGRFPAGTAEWQVPGESRYAPYEWESREVLECLESLGLKPVVSVGAGYYGERSVRFVVDGVVGDFHGPIQCKSMEGKVARVTETVVNFIVAQETKYAGVDVVMKVM